MKNFKYYLMALASIAMLNACSDDDPVPGNPTMDFQAEPSSALFGDSLPFTIKASDADVPLSTLKAQLYFSDEMVSETVIRTKVSGQEYNGKIYVPYLANIPNGTATLKFILQNINFTITEKKLRRGAESSGLPLPDSDFRRPRIPHGKSRSQSV